MMYLSYSELGIGHFRYKGNKNLMFGIMRKFLEKGRKT